MKFLWVSLGKNESHLNCWIIKFSLFDSMSPFIDDWTNSGISYVVLSLAVEVEDALLLLMLNSLFHFLTKEFLFASSFCRSKSIDNRVPKRLRRIKLVGVFDLFLNILKFLDVVAVWCIIYKEFILPN